MFADPNRIHALLVRAAPTLSSRFAGGRTEIPIWEWRTMQREESKHEKLEREQREREQMRQAVAAYSGPITKCPRGKTSDQHQDFGVAQTRGVRRHPGVSRSKS
jgi:lipopolysaccharide/colanic/teichoic acid biosynthesis glycosyltransferase